jgi:hypothetical protein
LLPSYTTVRLKTEINYQLKVHRTDLCATSVEPLDQIFTGGLERQEKT